MAAFAGTVEQSESGGGGGGFKIGRRMEFFGIGVTNLFVSRHFYKPYS